MSVTIGEQSEQLKAAAADHLPPDVLEVFDRSIEEFLREGVPAGAIATGDSLESFTLDDSNGNPVTLDQLVASGPAVIVFYRGGWCPYCNLALRTYNHQTSRSRPPRRQSSISRCSRIRAAAWRGGLASRSSRAKTSLRPNGSSGSIWQW
jgi:hypothetical protein